MEVVATSRFCRLVSVVLEFEDSEEVGKRQSRKSFGGRSRSKESIKDHLTAQCVYDYTIQMLKPWPFLPASKKLAQNRKFPCMTGFFTMAFPLPDLHIPFLHTSREHFSPRSPRLPFSWPDLLHCLTLAFLSTISMQPLSHCTAFYCSRST